MYFTSNNSGLFINSPDNNFAPNYMKQNITLQGDTIFSLPFDFDITRLRLMFASSNDSAEYNVNQSTAQSIR